MCIWTCLSEYIYMYLWIHTHLPICTYRYTYTHIYIYISFSIHICMYTYIYIYIYTQEYKCACKCMYVRMYVSMIANIHRHRHMHIEYSLNIHCIYNDIWWFLKCRYSQLSSTIIHHDSHIPSFKPPMNHHVFIIIIHHYYSLLFNTIHYYSLPLLVTITQFTDGCRIMAVSSHLCAWDSSCHRCSGTLEHGHGTARLTHIEALKIWASWTFGPCKNHGFSSGSYTFTWFLHGFYMVFTWFYLQFLLKRWLDPLINLKFMEVSARCLYKYCSTHHLENLGPNFDPVPTILKMHYARHHFGPAMLLVV